MDRIDLKPIQSPESQGPTLEVSPNVVSEAIAATKKASELRATAIKQLLAQRQQIELDLRSLGHIEHGSNGNGNGRPKTKATAGAGAYKKMPIAQIARDLLQECGGSLHGSEIETRAKAGGFKSGSEHFQSYLAVALKRAGGFENIGGNTWSINEAVAPLKREVSTTE